MKILKKINKGLVLTIIVLVVLIVYLVNVETKRNAEKPNIDKAIKEYISVINKYAVLPEEYQKIYGYSLMDDEKTEEELENVILEQTKKFEQDIKERTIDNKTAIETQKDILDTIIRQKNNFVSHVVTKYNKEVKKIKKYVFDDDQVIVSFDSQVETEVKYNDEGEENIKKETEKCEDESITLKYIDGKWKVVYADLMIYNVSYYGTGYSIF